MRTFLLTALALAVGGVIFIMIIIVLAAMCDAINIDLDSD